MLRIGIVAGEASSDLLGAQLIRDIKKQRSDIEVIGIGGKHLIASGCHSLFDMERLSVVGIFEVLGRCFELLNIRRKLASYFCTHPPDVFIGIDAPEFNLTLEKTLRKRGIKVIHYVSPSVWAWRENRLKKISLAVDLMLVLLPFELPYYQKSNIKARFVGHPLAEKLNKRSNKKEARRSLGLESSKTIIALMPGSRHSELKNHLLIFIKTALWCQRHHQNLHFVSSVINEDFKEIFTQAIRTTCPELPISIFIDDSIRVMEASDVLLLSSGTITLEAMLLKKPMVVGYRLSWLTYQIVKWLIHTPYIALPNLLGGKLLVPECIQHDCTPEILGSKLSYWLNNRDAVEQLQREFSDIHQQMLQKEEYSAADAVLSLLENTN